MEQTLGGQIHPQTHRQGSDMQPISLLIAAAERSDRREKGRLERERTPLLPSSRPLDFQQCTQAAARAGEGGGLLGFLPELRQHLPVLHHHRGRHSCLMVHLAGCWSTHWGLYFYVFFLSSLAANWVYM